MTKRTEIPRWGRQGAQLLSREIQLFEPPPGALYTIDATSRIVDVPRRTILIYCKHPFYPQRQAWLIPTILMEMRFGRCVASRRFGLFAATISPESKSFWI